MNRVLIVASITLASGDVPMLVDRTLMQLGFDTLLLSIEEDLPLQEAVFYESVKRFNRVSFNRRLMACIRRFRPDIVLIYGSNWGIFPRSLKQIKKRLSCRIVVWEGNLNYWQWYQSACFPYYDHFFSADSYPIPLLQKRSTGLKSVHYLPPCCDPEEHGRSVLSEEEKIRFKAEITFVGGGRASRRALFEKCVKYDLKLWGWGWDKSQVLDPFMIKETVYGLKKTKIYSASKICPNLQSGLYQVSGVSPRVFEVACCGRIPISEPQPDLFHLFVPDDEVIFFNNPNDLLSKVDYYLSHTEEMERVAERARQRVLAEHTYYHRLKKMMEIVLS